MNRIENFVHIQDVDMRIEEVKRGRREAETRLADNARLAASEKALEDAAHATHEIRTRLRSLELEADGLSAKIGEVERRLYDGRTTNPKELSGLEQDFKMLKREKGEIEDRILDAMVELESAEASQSKNSANFQQVTSESASATARARHTLDELQAAEAKLNSTREVLSTQISAADMALYENLRREKKGRALAPLKGSACGACGFALPSGLASRVRVGQELEFCSNCGRILVG